MHYSAQDPLLCCDTQIVYYPDPGLSLSCDTQIVHYPVPGLSLSCDTDTNCALPGFRTLFMLWHSLCTTQLQDSLYAVTRLCHYPVPGLFLCAVLCSARKSLAFISSSSQWTDYIAKELIPMEYLRCNVTAPSKTATSTLRYSTSPHRWCPGFRQHQPSPRRQRLAITSTRTSELSDYIYEQHFAFQPRPTLILT